MVRSHMCHAKRWISIYVLSITAGSVHSHCVNFNVSPNTMFAISIACVSEDLLCMPGDGQLYYSVPTLYSVPFLVCSIDQCCECEGGGKTQCTQQAIHDKAENTHSLPQLQFKTFLMLLNYLYTRRNEQLLC